MAPVQNRAELCAHGDAEDRAFLLDVVDHALEAVHPDRLIPMHVAREGRTLSVDGTSYDLDRVDGLVVLSVGKGAVDLAAALRDVLGDAVTRGLVVEKRGQGRPLEGIEVLEAGHPVPDASSRRAGRAVLDLAREAGPDDLVVVGVTGGTSALLAQPVEAVPFADLVETNRQLLASGAPIEDVNAVRKHLSRLKGGRLAAAIAPATVATLVVVDEVGGAPWGPTVPDPTTFADALAALERHGRDDEVPRSVREHLTAGRDDPDRETPDAAALASVPRQTVVLADATDLCEAARSGAEAHGVDAVVLSSRLVGESRTVGGTLAGVAAEVATRGGPWAPPVALVSGGETTVTLDDPAGAGEGGPNQEFALGFALGVDGLEGVSAIAVGTDGTDGPTDLAGGLVDGRTVARTTSQGLDVYEALAAHDAGGLLHALGDAVVTGPTGTNLMDLRVVLVRD